MDSEQKTILFDGQGKNADLELALNYQDNPDAFKALSVGEMVHLPKEIFLVSDAKPYRPIYECF